MSSLASAARLLRAVVLVLLPPESLSCPDHCPLLSSVSVTLEMSSARVNPDLLLVSVPEPGRSTWWSRSRLLRQLYSGRLLEL